MSWYGNETAWQSSEGCDPLWQFLAIATTAKVLVERVCLVIDVRVDFP
ncbi:hypothetical protein AVDCRST_MAG81-152 [uncultured Synechococcales cyanobacterium]|uniref:Uncharacterized protein n=1 Tax=uncultured Synechococcales cyanobacterium TaxID=1936017 RepID=A0A6J4UMZ1_9CYAN|nr:hypothetical protein AVDCRST_MAG81-152 [uncultured Synechococcales cyanobacterium]